MSRKNVNILIFNYLKTTIKFLDLRMFRLCMKEVKEHSYFMLQPFFWGLGHFVSEKNVGD